MKTTKQPLMRISNKKLKEIFNLSFTKTLEFDHLDYLSSKNGKKILSYLENEKFIPQLESNNSIAIIFTTKKIAKKLKKVMIVESENPKYDFCRLHNFLFQKTDFYKKRIPWKSFISKKAIIRSNHLSSEKVSIDEKTIIETNVVIFQHVKIGKNVRILPNVIIGEEGAEMARKQSNYLHFKHDGGVIVENGVNIQSNVSIKRGIFGHHTLIGKNTTIGSFVNIGHGVRIGSNCFIAPGTMFAGSVNIGADCYFGVGCSIVNGIKIGKNCKIGAGSVVTKDIPKNKVVVGNPAKIIRENT